MEQSQRISVSEICEQFSISEATARRDLETLAEAGKLQRVHGGAIRVRRAPPEFPMLQRQEEQRDEKRRIGQATAALVKEGETIFLGSGTTVMETARCLLGLNQLTIITNSLPVINLFANKPGFSVVSLGGILRPSELSFIGHITEQALLELRTDKVILGIRALDLEEGLTNDYLPETMTDRAILRAGREVILVADHSKLQRVSSAFVAPLKIIHTLVTDEQASAEFIAELRQRGVRVISA